MSDRLTCKPTSWFLLRAGLMLLMFGVFSVLFFVDGKWGYREKNQAFFAFKTIERATTEFSTRQASLSAEAWKAYAAKQHMDFPADPGVLPANVTLPAPWPAVLQDYDKMKEGLGQPRKLFTEYQSEVGLKKDVPEHPHDAGSIREQWIVFYICLALVLGAAFILLRTLGRSISVDGEALYPADGGRVPFADLVRLDLRKWETKGLAFASAKLPNGAERRVRLDGLTYGGFKKDEGEPAEQLMQRVKANFSGEILEYVIDDQTTAETPAPEA